MERYEAFREVPRKREPNIPRFVETSSFALSKMRESQIFHRQMCRSTAPAPSRSIPPRDTSIAAFNMLLNQITRV